MPSIPDDATAPSRIVQILDTALDQSHEVKAEVEGVVEHLGGVNEVAKARIQGGATELPADQVLRDGLAVEVRVQAVADNLAQVTDNLADGVNEAKAIELALGQSRLALAESEAGLAASRKAERAASHIAMHDQKTSLPNRTLFDDRLAQAIAGAERHRWQLAVMFLDLDRFKLVNDIHGHAAGDEVLCVVAERLMRNARGEDTVCRNGGDEFLFLLINPKDREALRRIAAEVREAIQSPIYLGGSQFIITPSIGLALYPEHGSSGPTLIARADAAMYRSKQLRSLCEFFEPALSTSSVRRRPTD